MTTDLLVRIDATTAGYDAALAKATRSTATYQSALTKTQLQLAALEQQLNAEIAAKAQKQAAAVQSIGTAAGKMGLAFGLGIGIAIKAAADFDEGMSAVQAATHETAGNMDLMRDAAIDAGEKTKYSATEAAGGIEALAKAGISTQDILTGGLTGALDLAAAGGQSVAEAAESAATAMSQFGLSGADIPHIADLLAAGAGKAQGEVSDMAMALNQAGLVANQTGLSIEDTTGALAAFAEKGLIGSDAGTSFKSMLQRLTPEGAKAAGAMEAYNIEAYDAQGNFVGLEKYAGKLAAGLGGLSAEQRNATLKTVFGSDAIRAATVLYENGAKGVGKWIEAVDDQGYAAETAALKMDNLKGDFDELVGTLETALIGTGEGAQGPLRDLVQNLTNLVNLYSNLPQPVKDGTLAVGAFLAVFGGSAFVFTRVVAGIGNMKTTISDLGVTSTRVGKQTAAMARSLQKVRVGAGLAGAAVLMTDLGAASDGTVLSLGGFSEVAGTALMGFAVGGPWGAALGAGVGLLTALTGGSDEAAEAQARLDSAAAALAATLDKQSGALTAQSLDEIKSALQDIGTFDVADQLGVDLDLVTRAAGGSEKSLKQLNSQLDAMADAVRPGGPADLANLAAGGVGTAETYRELTGLIAKLRGGVGQQSGVVAEAREKWDQYSRAGGTASDATKQSTAALKRQGAEIEETGESLEELIETNARYADAMVTSKRDSLELTQLYVDTEKAIRGAAQGFDENTKAGRANWSTILDVAEGWNGAERQARETKGAYAEARKTFIETSEALGMNSKKAEELADKYLKMNAPMIQAKEQAKETARETNIALEATMERAVALGGTDPTVKVSADTADANQKIAEFERNFYDMRNGITGKTVTFEMTSQAAKIAAQLGEPYAAGGAVHGPGTHTSDSIRARLSNNEHVFTAEEVRGAGHGSYTEGHAKLIEMRQRMRTGLNLEPLPGYATGGPVFDVDGKQSGIPQTGRLLRSVFDTISRGLSDALSKKGSEYLRQQAVPAGRVLRGPNGQVMMDGEPLTATHAAQIILSERLAGFNQYVMQGSWQPSSSYSGTSHTGPGVADTSPGNFSAQNVQRKVGIAAWGRNFAGAATAGSGAHIHGVSLLDPGTVGNSQAASYRAGGDGLGGSDYGPRPAMIPGLLDQVATIRANMFDRGGVLRPGLTMAYNGTGRNETVRTHAQEQQLQGRGAPGAVYTLQRLIELLSRPDVFHTIKGVNDELKRMRSEARDVTAAERDLRAAREASKQSTQHLRGLERTLTEARDNLSTAASRLSSVEDKINSQRRESAQAARELDKVHRQLARERASDVGPDKGAIRDLLRQEQQNARERDKVQEQIARERARAGKTDKAAVRDLLRQEQQLARERDKVNRQIARERARAGEPDKGAIRDLLRQEKQLTRERDKAVNPDLLRRERELTRERDHAREVVQRLADRNRVSTKAQEAADKDLERAEAALARQRGQLTDATAKWKQAQTELLEQSQAWTQTALDMGAAFGGAGTSVTAQGLLAKLTTSTQSAESFESLLGKLTRRKVDPDLIQQLRDQGPTAEGLALAQSLARAPQSLIRQINAQQAALETAARAVGTFGIGGGRSHARGGHGGGGTNPRNVDSHDRTINFNAPVYAQNPRRLAEEIHRKDRRALDLAGLP